MKRPFSILICCLLIPFSLSAQTKLGLKAGACLPSLANFNAASSLEEVRQADLYTGGLAVRIPLNAHLHLQPELLVRSHNRWFSDDYGQAQFSTDLQLPLLLQAGLQAGPVELFVEGGPYYSQCLADHDCTFHETIDLIGHHFRHFSFNELEGNCGLCLGLGAQFWNIQADLRWYWDRYEVDDIDLRPQVLRNLDCCLSVALLL